MAESLQHHPFAENLSRYRGLERGRGDLDAEDTWGALMEGGWAVDAHDLDSPWRQMAIRWASRREKEVIGREELRIAARRARGESLKVIAWSSGKTIPAVGQCLAAVGRKLQLRCEADLVTFFPPGLSDRAMEHGPPPAGLCVQPRGACDTDAGVLLTYRAPRWAIPACLSEAERSIVRAIIAGASHQETAVVRGCARRTVANHIASIHRKLNVHSRIDLLVALRCP
jgi:DNA-binding CsgD family transcriptional regulator